MGSRPSIAAALKRHKQAGRIRQLARGLYDHPVDHATLGRIAASTDAVARALVRRDAVRLQPTGAYAANLLGLSDQVPSRVEFLTDGPSRRVKLGRQEIVLKHTTPRNMAVAGRRSGTIIQALRWIGAKHVDHKVLSILRRQLSDSDRRQLRKDMVYAPAWIREILRGLAADE